MHNVFCIIERLNAPRPNSKWSMVKFFRFVRTSIARYAHMIHSVDVILLDVM